MTKYDIAARATLAGLDNFEGVLSATQQRAIFGQNVSGKKLVRINCDNQGTLAIRHACWEGTHTSYAWEVCSFEALVMQALGG